MAVKPGLLARIREVFSPTPMSIGDPAFAAFIRGSAESFGFDAWTALQNPAFYRGVSLISQTIASLPLRTWRNNPETGKREEVSSFLSENPAGPYQIPPFNFWELVVTYLVTMGEVGLFHVYNGAGQLIGLLPLSPIQYVVRWTGAGKEFLLMGNAKYNNKNTFTSDEFTQITGLSVDGLRGLSPMTLFRRQHDLSAAQDQAAMKAMTSGLLIGGVLIPEEDLTEIDGKKLKAGLTTTLTGPENSNGLAIMNRRLRYESWMDANRDLTYVDAREFSVHENARILGVPAHLLYSTSKEQSFASGLEQQAAGLHRYTLSPITSRLESGLSPLLPKPRFIEWDYSGLLQGTPAESEASLIASIAGRLRTPNEARALLNLPAVAGGDELLPADTPPPVQVAGPKPEQGKI